MRTEEAIQRAGNAAELARLLKVSPAAISQWGENVPELRLYQLRDLRPQWFRSSALTRPKAA